MTGAFHQAAAPLVVGAAVATLGAAVATLLAAGHAARVRSRGHHDRHDAPAWFVAVVRQAELGIDPVPWWPWAQAAALVVAGLVAWRWPVAAVVVAGAAVVRWRFGGPRRAHDDAAVRGALPEALDAMVAAMASGGSLTQAVIAAAERPDPAGRDLAEVARHHRSGLALQEALDAWAARRPAAGVALVVDALALAGRTGGSQAAALRSAGDTLREREALAREVRALGAQAQLSAWVLVAVPVGFAATVALLDRRIAVFLVATAAGWGCLVGGVALDAAGAWWMRRLLRRFS